MLFFQRKPIASRFEYLIKIFEKSMRNIFGVIVCVSDAMRALVKNIFYPIFIFISLHNSALAQNCIENLEGITVEKIQHFQLLFKQNGKNLAIVTTDTTVYISPPIIPDQIKQIRFFSQRLCTTGAESKFHINGSFFEVSRIELFK
jgi:hypothetical protein